ncbi:hypothetical protein [Roseivirga seohaensis]|uniref:hypothetical protein n=1 Tax=Roseivirga seohaensis TaxID=1914963 RepID=UPI003BADB421
MDKSNLFSEKFSKKSDEELKTILISKQHVKEAKQAALWELERREEQPNSKVKNIDVPTKSKTEHQMSKADKNFFKWRMLITGISFIAIALYFNYETLLATKSSLKEVSGRVEYSKTIIERVSATNRSGYKSYSNKATLEIKISEHPRPFRIFENIGQSRIHDGYQRLARLLNKGEQVSLLIPENKLKYGPEFFELTINGKTEISIESTKSQDYTTFALLTSFGALFIFLGMRANWIEQLRGMFRS